MYDSIEFYFKIGYFCFKFVNMLFKNLKYIEIYFHEIQAYKYYNCISYYKRYILMRLYAVGKFFMRYLRKNG